MDHREALEYLLSGTDLERLAAARFLARNPREEDALPIRAALATESDSWTRNALAIAMGRTTGAGQTELAIETDDSESLHVDAVAEATEQVADMFVHELRRWFGFLKLSASREVPNYDGSRTKADLEKASDLLDSIERLGRTSGVPLKVEFDLNRVVSDIAASISESFPAVSVTMIGPRPALVNGDPDFVGIAITNGLVNAVEATASTPSSGGGSQEVIISWDETDVDYWVAILDNGLGLPERQDLFEFATTTKEQHLGTGLAIARAAMRSLGGSIELETRADQVTGARFTLRWPKPG